MEDAIENRKKGEVGFELFSKYPQEYLFVKVSERIEKITFSQKQIHYTHAIQLDENKYLFACGKSAYSEENDDYEARNCEIMDKKGETLNHFFISDAVTDIQTNSKHEILIAYYDRDVMSGIDSTGLTQYTDNGKRKDIYFPCYVVDCTGLNVESDNSIWAYVYKAPDTDIWNKDWNSLIKFTNKKPEKEWDFAEYMEPYIAVSGDYVFLSETERTGNVCKEYGGKLYKLEEALEFVEEYKFYNSDNTELKIYCAQKDLIVCWADNCLYKICMTELLRKNEKEEG
jgi:hypothetical protein